MKVNVDGKVYETSEAAKAAMDDVAHSANSEAFFPTVSLVSTGTRVWCRFAHDDILCRNRESVGAPAGRKVYCLDGSLLLSA